ncbi:unnamed protein product, partial [Prorocentrum cordatum]
MYAREQAKLYLQNITMSAIEGMFKQYLQPLQQDVAAIKLHGISRDELQQALEPVQAEMNKLTERVDFLERSGSRSPSATSGAAPSITSHIEQKIFNLEKQFSELTAGRDRECNADMDTAMDFLKGQFVRTRVPEHIDIFTKGAVNSIVFVKFGSADKCDKFVNVLGKAQ